MPWIEWYNSLAKPNWTPAPATIGLIWQILSQSSSSALDSCSCRCFEARSVGWWRCPSPSTLWQTNLIFNPIQSGMRNLPLAALDILVVWAKIIWMIVAVWWHYKWVAVAQMPYFVWVSLATVLQLSITAMNWGRS